MTTTEVVNVEPQVTVNGQAHPLGEVGGHVTLLEWLRAAGFTGSKEGCAEGECGACAVMVARPDGEGSSRWTAINACLVPAAGLDNQEVITAEGLGQPGALHPVQREMADRGGSQCGYCTPGFICSMASEFYRSDRRAAARQRQWGRAGGRDPARHQRPGGGTRQVPTGPTRRRPAMRPTTSTGRTASTCTRCPETCAAAPVTGRSGTPPTHWAPRTPPTRCSPGSASRHRPRLGPEPAAARARSTVRPIWRRPSTCSPRTRRPRWWPAPPTGASN